MPTTIVELSQGSASEYAILRHGGVTVRIARRLPQREAVADVLTPQGTVSYDHTPKVWRDLPENTTLGQLMKEAFQNWGIPWTADAEAS